MGGIVSKKSPDENNESVENSEGKDESLQEYDGDDPFNDNERLNTGDSNNIDSTHNNNNNDDDDDGDNDNTYFLVPCSIIEICLK